MWSQQDDTTVHFTNKMIQMFERKVHNFFNLGAL